MLKFGILGGDTLLVGSQHYADVITAGSHVTLTPLGNGDYDVNVSALADATSWFCFEKIPPASPTANLLRFFAVISAGQPLLTGIYINNAVVQYDYEIVDGWNVIQVDSDIAKEGIAFVPQAGVTWLVEFRDIHIAELT